MYAARCLIHLVSLSEGHLRLRAEGCMRFLQPGAFPRAAAGLHSCGLYQTLVSRTCWQGYFPLLPSFTFAMFLSKKRLSSSLHGAIVTRFSVDSPSLDPVSPNIFTALRFPIIYACRDAFSVTTVPQFALWFIHSHLQSQTI